MGWTWDCKRWTQYRTVAAARLPGQRASGRAGDEMEPRPEVAQTRSVARSELSPSRADVL